MRGNIRNYFPGGNTSIGFYSFYQYILGQREAEHIVCIKGGPGTGKSTFMRSIAEHFLDKGEDVDCFWCSSDPESLDGILLKERQIAFLDGTSPHIVDPVNPGAVDTILHLGEFWDGAAIRKHKDYIMQSSSIIKNWFNCAYNNLNAAASLRNTLTKIYSGSVSCGEMYQITAGIINKELSHKPVSMSEGKCKKYFATAITPKGHLSHMKSIIRGYRKLYLLSAPIGFETGDMMRIISENAVHRGFCVEEYYCPMDPEGRPEHVLVPELEVGFITLNDYHDMESWECSAETFCSDMREFIDWNYIEKYRDVIDSCEKGSNDLIEGAIGYLGKAKQEHDVLEGYYIPCMNFEKIKELTAEWICKIERKEL